MSLKYIVIPAPALIGKQPKRGEGGAVVLSAGGQPEYEDVTFSLAQCVEYIVDNDEAFSRPASRVRAGARILKAFETDKPYAELKHEDWQTLDAAFETPSAGYGRWSNAEHDANGVLIRVTEVHIKPRTFLDLINAVNEASNTEPKHLLSKPELKEETPTAPGPTAPAQTAE